MADSFENLEALKSEYQVPETFNVSGISMARVTDSNFGIYSAGQIRYNVMSMYASSSTEKPMYELSESYAQIYVTNTLTLTNATFTNNNNGATPPVNLPLIPTYDKIATGLNSRQNVYKVHNKSGLALKDPLALVNQYWFSMANQDVITSSTHSYFYNLLKLRTENKEDLERKMSIIDRILDNGESMVRDSRVGEINNFNSEEIARDAFGLDECNKKNEKYGKKFVPFADGSNTALLEATGFDKQDLLNLEIPFMEFVNDNTIVYYDIVKIYLRDIDDFFKNAPSLLQIPKFNLTINTNISDSSSWSVTYDRGGYVDAAKSNPNINISVANAGALDTTNTAGLAGDVQKIIQSLNKFYFHPKKVTANLGNATACPWLLADCGLSRNNSLKTGLSFSPDNTTNDPVLTITSRIGWTNKNQTFLFIPQVTWNPEMTTSIISDAPYTFYVKKATIDMNTFIGLNYKTAGIKKPLNNNWSRVRNIYLVPYHTQFGLSTGTSGVAGFEQTGVLPYESP